MLYLYTHNFTSGLGSPLTLTMKRRYVFSIISVSFNATRKYGALRAFLSFLSSAVTTMLYEEILLFINDNDIDI